MTERPAGTEPASRSTGENIRFLDGLRGIAIFLVVLLHTWEISWFNLTAFLHSPVDLGFLPATGFIGVELFFFLSAFCLALPYARHRFEGAKEPTLQRFFVRRAAKIIPSYWLNIALLLLFFPHPGMPSDGRFVLYLGEHLLFIHNWRFETHDAINGVFWSLGVEVQLYLLFPVLLWLYRRSPLVTLCGLAALAQCWRALIVYWFRQDSGVVNLIWHDFQLPGHLDTFGAGIGAAFAVVYLRHRKNTGRFVWLCTVGAIAALVAFVLELQACYGRRFDHDPLWLWYIQYRLLIVSTFFVLGVAGSLSHRFFQGIVANPIFRFLSFISYNLYLWHQVIAATLLRQKFPAFRTPDPHDDPTWQGLFMAISWGMAIVISTLLTVFWERPFLTGAIRFPKKR